MDPDRVARLCQQQYAQCRFRIASDEWTVLAGVVLERNSAGAVLERNSAGAVPQLQVVALGTGLKCLPAARVARAAEHVVHDSHAEVLARRAFVRFLWDQLAQAERGASTVLVRDGAAWRLDVAAVHLYASHAPCGDASMQMLAASKGIVLKDGSIESVAARRITTNDDATESISKGIATNHIAAPVAPTFLRGRAALADGPPGALRTKPGRADGPPSHSMSCSDKLALWTVVGLQGALLSHWLAPVRPASLTVGDGFDARALRRALCERLVGAVSPVQLRIASTAVRFAHAHEPGRRPAAAGHVWWLGGAGETLVGGLRQGASAKRTVDGLVPATACSSVAPFVFAMLFGQHSPSGLDRVAAKLAATAYQRAKGALLAAPFEHWLVSDVRMRAGRQALLAQETTRESSTDEALPRQQATQEPKQQDI